MHSTPCMLLPGPPAAGGRSGATYQTSGPLGDLWTFDLASLTWQEVPQAGAGPLPRFLHSYVQYTPPGSAGGGGVRCEGGEGLLGRAVAARGARYETVQQQCPAKLR